MSSEHSSRPEPGSEDAVLTGRHEGRLANLWRRARLTYQYRGPQTAIWRLLSFPLRATPLRARLGLEGRPEHDRLRARRRYRRSGLPVTVVIASYRDAAEVTHLVSSIRRTTRRELVRIVVADDASGAEHLSALRRIKDIEVVAGEQNLGFAANVNRGLRAADPRYDVVVLNSDMSATEDWLASLQDAAHEGGRAGVVGAKLLYPDRRIQFAGTVRNRAAPEWFDHRFRFKASSFGPANVPVPVLAVTGACMYIRREVLDELDRFDESFAMAYEDVDYCLRAWQAGHRVLYCPAAELIHAESAIRGTEVTERERRSQRLFWERWRPFFEARPVRTASGRLRVIYVTENTTVGGGHRDVFEQLNGLHARGHDVALYTLSGPPDWFELRAPVHTFADYQDLTEALARHDAIKIATWWRTAAPVWEASVVRGLPVYLVQDIETSYYPDDALTRDRVLASYRDEFSYCTISRWNRDRLADLGRDAALVAPGLDLGTFRVLPEARRREDMVLAIGRKNPLKRFELTASAWRALPDPRPELCLFGIEPDVAPSGARYIEGPSDEQVNELLNECTVFVQTSAHEGFALPPLEAMAAGAAVVCTDAHGNRDFCRDGVNCLMPADDPASVRDALARVLGDHALRERLGAAGVETARAYRWERRVEELEAFLAGVADGQRQDLDSGAVPDVRRRAR